MHLLMTFIKNEIECFKDTNHILTCILLFKQGFSILSFHIKII